MSNLSTASRAEGTGQRAVSWAPLAVILCGTFVYVLDFFVVNVALPSIQSSLARQPGRHRVGGGRVRPDQRRVPGHRGTARRPLRPQAGVLRRARAFTVASALCAAAPDAGFLVAARLAQGVAAAIMAPNVLSILGTTYTGQARVKAISVYGMVMGVAAVAGQLLGGLLIAANPAGLGWRTIFWVNVPVGIAALVARPRLVPASARDRRGPARPARRGAVHRGARRDRAAAARRPRRTAGPPGRGRAWPPAPVLLAVFAAHLRGHGAARRRSRCSTLRSSPSARSAPGWPARCCSGASRRRATCCSLFTCSRAAGSARSRPAGCSPCSPPATWPPRSARPRSPCGSAAG